MAKIKLEDLLNRHLKDGFQSKDVTVDSLGGEITIVKQPLTTIMRIIDGLDESERMSSKFDVFAQLIYQCVPLLHDKKLQEKYECAEPQDIVMKVLNDNMNDLEKLANNILAFYGLDSEKMKDEVKKP